MSYEIRRVAPDWEHPVGPSGRYRPLLQLTADEIARANVEYGASDYRRIEPDDVMPEWSRDEATAWQLYHTVSEGIPASPVFATRSELVDWLVGEKKLSRAAAERFADVGSIPSGITLGLDLFAGLPVAEALWGDRTRARELME